MAFWTKDDSSPGGGEVAQPSNIEMLVVQAQGGDQRAFERLYATYRDPINRYLVRMVGHDGVGCELTQEVFLKAWRGLHELRTPARFAAWLYSIALNCARTYQRHYSHMQTVPLDVYIEAGGGPSVEGPEEGFEKAELLQLALAQVSPVYRSCLILYVIEELPQQQVAERLNIKGNCVSKYVSRGKEELRQIYHQLLRDQSEGLPKGRRGR